MNKLIIKNMNKFPLPWSVKIEACNKNQRNIIIDYLSNKFSIKLDCDKTYIGVDKIGNLEMFSDYELNVNLLPIERVIYFIEKEIDKQQSPFIDNRIVVDKTFAIRFKNFVEKVKVSDACAYDEREAMLSYATKLLNYQLKTVENEEEKEYLTRLGVYPLKSWVKTYDGVDISEPTTLYTCMVEPSKGESCMIFKITSVVDLDKLNKNRVLFFSQEKCESYLKDNIKMYSKEDLKKMGIIL